MLAHYGICRMEIFYMDLITYPRPNLPDVYPVCKNAPGNKKTVKQ